ncbi:MAG: FtsX-like permease family protein [Clostridiaceae bacterium]
MILRNSRSSILRMPLKAILFTLLIVAVTAFLYLGVNTFTASEQMLRACDENYTTIASIEYLGDNYPDESIYDEAMLSEVSQIDFNVIAGQPEVLLWQPTDCSIGLIDGFVAHSASVYYRLFNVLVITDVTPYQTGGEFYAKTVDCLYSYRTDMQGKHFFFYTDGFDFDPDPDAYYVIHGYSEGLSSFLQTIQLSPFYSYAATLSGVDCSAISPCLQIESPEALYAEPNNVYLAMADYYNVMNNKVYIYRTQALADLEEFHQERLRLVSGRLFTEEEAQSGAKVCVMTETLANASGFAVGDTVTLRTMNNTGLPAADCYWGTGSLANSDDYEIVGVVNYYEGLQYNVYVPSVPASAQPESYVYKLGQATLKNGSADAFVEAVTPLLPARATIDIYDQGYQAVADSLSVIRGASAALSAVAFVAAVVVLLFFAFLFVEKQRDTVETMRCFGMSKAETRLYLLFGAGLIALIAVCIGVWIGTRFAAQMISRAYSFVSELQTVDLRYSSGYLGIAKNFTPVPVASVPLAVLVALLVFLLALGFCLHFAERTINGRVLQTKIRNRNYRPPKRSSTAGRGAMRYSMLSIRRSGARTLIVPSLAVVMLLFIATLLSALSSYETAKEALYDTTTLRGYCTTMTGKYAGNLLIRNDYVQQLIDLGDLDDIALTYHKRYRYLGVSEQRDGTGGNAAEVPAPTDGILLTDMLNQIADAPYLVFTNNVADAPEFYFSQFTGEFLPGYDESMFAERNWTEPACIVSTQFLENNGVQLGDTIRIYVVNGTSYSSSDANNPPFIGLELKVVGTFYRQASEDYIYCPLSGGVLNLDSQPDGETSKLWKFSSFGYLRRGHEDITALTPQRLFDVLLDESYVSSFSFTLKDTRRLTEFKDALETIGFSGPKQDRDIRVAVAIEDKAFVESVSSISQRSTYLEILYPVLLALVCAVGVIAAFLMINSRREEIAVMRGLGTQKKRIFLIFFYEQLFLLAAGTLCGAAVWLSFGDAAQLGKPDLYAFFVCYALGAGIALFLQNRKSAISILSEKE